MSASDAHACLLLLIEIKKGASRLALRADHSCRHAFPSIFLKPDLWWAFETTRPIVIHEGGGHYPVVLIKKWASRFEQQVNRREGLEATAIR
jgi:hypothetical protein